jgi:hypothetical protein
VRFAKHDHVVETFTADRADESLNVSILPGRSGCDRMVPNAHCTDRCKKTGPYEVSRSRMRYRGAWSHGNASVTWREIHSAVGFAVTPQQNFECDRRQDKEVDRRDAVDVIAEKRPPALRRWPRVAAHVPSDRRLGDLEAELMGGCSRLRRRSNPCYRRRDSSAMVTSRV